VTLPESIYKGAQRRRSNSFSSQERAVNISTISTATIGSGLKDMHKVLKDFIRRAGKVTFSVDGFPRDEKRGS
jgi:hypothetical protein